MFQSYEEWNHCIVRGFQIDPPHRIMKAGRSYWRLPWRNEDRAYKCSVRTAHWIQRVFFFWKGSPWVLYGEPISVRCNNYRKHISVLCGQNSEFLVLVKDKFSIDHQVKYRSHEPCRSSVCGARIQESWNLIRCVHTKIVNPICWVRCVDHWKCKNTCITWKWLRAGRSGDRIPVGARFFAHVQTGPGAHPASCTMGTGSFPGVKRPGRGADHLPPSKVPRSRECRAIPLPPSGLSSLLRGTFTYFL
jgi:hypothetical protein